MLLLINGHMDGMFLLQTQILVLLLLTLSLVQNYKLLILIQIYLLVLSIWIWKLGLEIILQEFYHILIVEENRFQLVLMQHLQI